MIIAYLFKKERKMAKTGTQKSSVNHLATEANIHCTNFFLPSMLLISNSNKFLKMKLNNVNL